MPAIVIGMSSFTGSRAKRVPITTSVAHFSRYPSSGYRDTDAPRNNRSSKWGTRRLAPNPRMSYMPSRAARWISAIASRSNVADSRNPGCHPLAPA